MNAVVEQHVRVADADAYASTAERPADALQRIGLGCPVPANLEDLERRLDAAEAAGAGKAGREVPVDAALDLVTEGADVDVLGDLHDTPVPDGHGHVIGEDLFALLRAPRLRREDQEREREEGRTGAGRGAIFILL